MGFKGYYTGVDISPQAIKLAKKLNINNQNCNFILKNIFNYEKDLHDYTYEKLSSDEDVLIYGKSLNKGAIISFNINGIHANDLAMFLDQKNIAVRTGHHCCQPLMKYLNINSTVRASFGIYNNKSDADLFVSALIEAKKFFK